MKKAGLALAIAFGVFQARPAALFAGRLELIYSSYVGGSGSDHCHGVALGTGGDVYLIGYTTSLDFPTVAPYQPSLAGGDWDAFVARIGSSGSTLLYSGYLGGTDDDDYGYGLSLGAGGELLLTGSTLSHDFPTLNPYQPSKSSWSDAFVARISSSGSALTFSTYCGGSANDAGNGVALGAGGEISVVGYTLSPNFPTVNSFQAALAGTSSDAFVLRLESSGSALLFSTYLGGDGTEEGCGISTAAGGGEDWVVGYTASGDFPLSSPYQDSYAGGIYDAFVSRLGSSGSALPYSTYLGGEGIDRGYAIVTNPAGGEVWVSGPTESADFPTAAPYQADLAGSSDVFLSRLSSSGSSLAYSSYLGGLSSDEPHALALGSAGEVHLTGYASYDFPTFNPYQASSAGLDDIFVSKLASSGSPLIFSTFLGGAAFEEGWGIAVGSEGEVYVAGYTGSANFPTARPFQPGSSGSWDGTVSKLIYLPAAPWIHDFNGDGTSDIGVFQPSTGLWSVRDITRVYLGGSSDEPVPADYNGNGTSDLAVFRASSGLWSVRNLTRFYLGSAGDIAVPGDYDGDGVDDAGIFRPAAGLWSIRNVTRAYLGSPGDQVVPGYYNGDARRYMAIFRGTSGLWSVRDVTRFYLGASGDSLVPGDFSGDGRWEGGIYRPSTGLWSIRDATRFYLGGATDDALPADYDGDGADEAGIFRGSTGLWSVRNLTRVYFGGAGSVPVAR